MLVQLHHQSIRNSEITEMVSQREINSYSEMRNFVEETRASHPPPKGFQFLAVEESSPSFVKTVGKKL